MRWLPTLLSLLLLSSACSSVVAPPAPTGERAVEREAVSTARAQRADLSGVLNLNGEIRPRGQQTLTARASGRLDRLSADLGSAVQEGQVLAEIDPAGFQLRVAQAEAVLATAEAQLAGMLVGGRPDESAQAEAILHSARARLTALEQTPRGDTPERLLANLRAARDKVAELEANAARTTFEAAGRADAAVQAARARVEQLQREPNTSQNQTALNEARQALQRAEEAAAQARRPVSAEELARARLELINAQDQLILASASVSEAELESARAAVQAAEIGVRRAGVAPTEVDVKAAQANAQRAAAELEVARLQLQESTVRSPLSGAVSEVFTAPGALVGPGTPLLTVMPLSYEVTVPLPESQVGQVVVGQPVKLGVDAYPDQEFAGAVKAIAPAIDPRTRNVLIRIEVTDPAGRLKTGMFAQLSIAAPPKKGVLLVPREAVVGRLGEQSVFQVIDGRARRQPVQTGVGDGRNVEILSGLAEGAEVVVSSAGQSEGATIR